MVDYFIHNYWQLWLLISVVCLIAELSTGGFFIICFAIGALATALAAPFGAGFLVQLVVFAVVSALSIFLVRPVIMKYFHGGRGDQGRVSNADALMGREGRVSETIEDNGFGRVAIDGDDWKAVSADSSRIEKGEKVRVVGRESIIITVERI